MKTYPNIEESRDRSDRQTEEKVLGLILVTIEQYASKEECV